MRYIICFFALAFFFTSNSSTAAERTAILCYGEYPHEYCPGNTTIYRDCETDAKAVGKEFCTIETADGPKVVPHFVDFISQMSGNKCGYNWFKITCNLHHGGTHLDATDSTGQASESTDTDDDE